MIGNLVANCRWLHPSVKKVSNNVPKVPDKGKQIVTHQKVQKKWQPTDNPLGIGSSLAFSKPGELTDSSTTTTKLMDGSTSAHDTIEYQEMQADIVNDDVIPIVTPIEAGSFVHHDKSVFTFSMPLENATD